MRRESCCEQVIFKLNPEKWEDIIYAELGKEHFQDMETAHTESLRSERVRYVHGIEKKPVWLVYAKGEAGRGLIIQDIEGHKEFLFYSMANWKLLEI